MDDDDIPPPHSRAWGPGRPRPRLVVGEAIAFGWRAFWRNAGPMVTFVLIILLAQLPFVVIAQAASGTATGVVIQAAAWLVQLLLAMGLIRAALVVCDGRAPDVNLLLQRRGYAAYFLATVVLGVAVAVPVALAVLLNSLALLILVGLAIVLPVALTFMLFGYAIVEDPALGPIQALRRSAELTRGSRVQLAGLMVVLGGVNLLGVLACGVGIVVSYGITALSLAYTYRVLGGQAIISW